MLQFIEVYLCSMSPYNLGVVHPPMLHLVTVTCIQFILFKYFILLDTVWKTCDANCDATLFCFLHCFVLELRLKLACQKFGVSMKNGILMLCREWCPTAELQNKQTEQIYKNTSCQRLAFLVNSIIFICVLLGVRQEDQCCSHLSLLPSSTSKVL